MMRTVEQLGKLSAEIMKTTARVGDASEDASMTEARPVLSKMNALGLITTDSQMGKKSSWEYNANVGVIWQRSYISGFMSRKKAEEFKLRMDLVGGVIVYICEHATKYPSDKAFAAAYRPGVTRITNPKNGDFEVTTRAPLLPLTLQAAWVNLLPETNLANDTRAMKRIAPSVVQVELVDMEWGRELWLFETVVKALSGKVGKVPVTKRKAKQT